MGLLRYEYLGPEVLAGFDTYKYSCRDTSPLSNYVMHPFWNQCVKVIFAFFAGISNIFSSALPSVGGSKPSHPSWISLLYRALGALGNHRLWFQVNFDELGRKSDGDVDPKMGGLQFFSTIPVLCDDYDGDDDYAIIDKEYLIILVMMMTMINNFLKEGFLSKITSGWKSNWTKRIK